MKLSLLLLNIAFIPALLAASDVPEIEDGKSGMYVDTEQTLLLSFLSAGFEQVTCGSIIKLTNKANNYKLHSHGVTYGKVFIM